jgi:hypothetical protein
VFIIFFVIINDVVVFVIVHILIFNFVSIGFVLFVFRLVRIVFGLLCHGRILRLLGNFGSFSVGNLRYCCNIMVAV